MDRLVTGAPIYWIGGSSCGGKSTLARRLADEHGMALYSCDEHYEEHLLGISDQAPSAMRTVSRMSADEIFYARSVSEQLSTYVDVLMEDFAYVWRDLATRAHGPVVVEGNQLLPWVMEPLLRPQDRAIWLIPTEDFQREHYAKRGWIHGILRSTSNPEVAFNNWMTRDALFAERVRTEAQERGLEVMAVDGSRTLDEMYAEVLARLGL